MSNKSICWQFNPEPDNYLVLEEDKVKVIDYLYDTNKLPFTIFVFDNYLSLIDLVRTDSKSFTVILVD